MTEVHELFVFLILLTSLLPGFAWVMGFLFGIVLVLAIQTRAWYWIIAALPLMAPPAILVFA